MNNFKLSKYFIAILITLWSFWLLIGSQWQFLVNMLVALPITIIAWTLAYFVYDHRNTQTVDARGKAVLITGCDSGFGHQLAKKLDALGYTVFAGLLFPDGDGARQLKNECSHRLKIKRMDVTNVDEVETVCKEIGESGTPLWAVVNNAGIAIGCPFDWGKDIDQYKQTFDVNVFGIVRVTKNCLPLLRQSKGRIVNVASVAGRITTPLMAHYCMAKHSVRVFSDVMRREMYNDDVKVITLEPTFYRTPIIDFDRIKRVRNKIFEETPEAIRKAYSESTINCIDDSDSLVNMITREQVSEVVETLEKAVTLVEPKLFYRCAGYHDIMIWILALLPETILDGLIHTLCLNSYTVNIAKRYLNMFGKQKLATKNA